MNGNIATEIELVKSKINSTASSRNEMLASLKNLESVINSASEWIGADATAHKAALLDFIKKLRSSAAWMEAAGNQAVAHSQALHERAMKDKQTARIFN